MGVERSLLMKSGLRTASGVRWLVRDTVGLNPGTAAGREALLKLGAFDVRVLRAHLRWRWLQEMRTVVALVATALMGVSLTGFPLDALFRLGAAAGLAVFALHFAVVCALATGLRPLSGLAYSRAAANVARWPVCRAYRDEVISRRQLLALDGEALEHLAARAREQQTTASKRPHSWAGS